MESMKKGIIIYQSKYGATKKYVDWLTEKFKFDCIETPNAKIKDIDVDEVRGTFEVKLYQLKEDIDDLDKEKVLKIAKKKAQQIQDAAVELVNYAVEKGTPMLEKSANAIREKAAQTTKEVLKRLEKEEK